ncbi:MAG: hypothetical protein Fur0032_16180 [Terrimicrobiaceae bacterium]
MVCGIAFLKQPVDTLEYDKVFRCGKVAGLSFVHDEALILGVAEGLVLHIHDQARAAKFFHEQASPLGESERGKQR